MKEPKVCVATSWKGGTGKTTLAVACISILAETKKILVIDLDSNLSMTSVFKMVDQTPNSLSLLDGMPIKPIRFSENIDVIPSEMKISQRQNIAPKTLKKRLEKCDLSKYDYVFIDPPGTMDALTRMAITAADLIVIPAKPSLIDFKAVGYVLEEMEMMDIEADVNVVLNDWDSKRNLNGIYEKFETLDDLFFPFPIGAMKSLKNITADPNFKLFGYARKAIVRLIEGVVL